MWVQFYVVLLEIPIQLICAQDLCDANQLEQKARSESRRAAHHSFAEVELSKSKSPPSGNVPDRSFSLETCFVQNKFPTRGSKITDGLTKQVAASSQPGVPSPEPPHYTHRDELGTNFSQSKPGSNVFTWS